MADKIVQNIVPVFDDKAVKDFSKKMEKVSVGAKFSKVLKGGTKIAGGGIAGLSILGLLFRGLTEEVGKSNEAIDKWLANADEIATISSDIGVSSGRLALFSAGASTLGINQEDLMKVIASVQQEQAGGSLKENYGNMNVLDALTSLQARWKVAGDEEKRLIEKSVGLRGKKASEFLQSDITSVTGDLAKSTNTSEAKLTESVSKLAELEQYQATLKQQTELIDMENKAKLLNKETLERQANYQRNFNKNIDEILKNNGRAYDKQALRDNAMLQLSLVMDELGQPLFKMAHWINDKVNEKGMTLQKLIFVELKKVIVESIETAWEPIRKSLPKFLGGEGKTPSNNNSGNNQGTT